MNIHAPSPKMKPSRSALNGLDALFGVSFLCIETVPILQKPSIRPRVIQASIPPVISIGICPIRIVLNAYPSASEDEVHPVETTWLIPYRRNAILISLDTIPTNEATMAYGLTRFNPCSNQIRYWRS